MTEPVPGSDPEAKTILTPPELDASARTVLEGPLKAWGAALEGVSQDSPNQTLKTPSAQLGRASALALLMPRAILTETGKPATLMAPADFTMARQLGRGGMGVVYAARQESLSREVALKVLAPEVTSEHFEERFATEARLAGRLEHPNIVPIYELGRSAEGRLYLAMKLVKGEALSAVLKRGDAPERRLLEILMAIADALAFAHARNVIHRDLKPDNVMLGEFGEVQVMDWGLAIDLSEPRERGHAGTPAYMSPEQADGDPEHLGPWCDVYLLGAMLYEVLTGTPPHRGDGILQVLLAAAKGDVQKPSERAPGRRIPGDLEALAMRALEKDHVKRLGSALEFKAGIATHLAHADALGLLDKARALIEAPDDDPEGERLRRAETLLEQARSLWPESELARSLQMRVRALQADLALDRGEGRKAAAIVRELAPTEGVTQERIEQLTRAAQRQTTRLRNQIVAGVVLALAMVLGHRVVSGVTEERAAVEKRRDARFAFAARAGDAWRALAREEGREAVKDALAKLDETRHESGWDPAETDEPLVAAFAAWQALATGEERRAIEVLPRAAWRKELEEVWTGDPLAAGDAWRARAKSVPPELSRAAEACLVAALARALPAARLRETAPAIVERLDALGARAILADARSGAPETIVGSVPVRVSLEKGRPGPEGRKETDRVVVAHDAASGRELWRFPPPLEGAFSWSPRSPLLVAPHPGPEGAVVLVAWGTDVLALDPATGVVRSRARILDEVAALLPAPDGRILAVERATAGRARSRLVPCEPGKVLAPVIPGSSGAALTFEASSARAWIGAPTGDKPSAKDAEAALARLAVARKIDPTNAAWDLEEAKMLDLLGRREDAAAALVRFASGDLSPWELAIAAPWASERGLPAEKLLERAILRAALLGHDADASPALLGNAGFAARRAAEKAAKKGDTEGMLRELALARELATVVEGDRTLVPLEKDWLRANSREGELKALAPYEHPARVAGGTLSMPEGLVELFDVAIGMSIALPIVFVALSVALWRRSRPTQIRDLRALGFRTGSSRAVAFLANPVLRFTHTFLAYASRGERALLAFLALVAFLSVSYLVLVTATIAKVAAIPAEAATGFLGHPSAAEHFADANERAAGVEHVLVEGALERGEEERARALLEEILARHPRDPFALEVKGVLEEPRSREAALALYDQAGQTAGDAGAPGRWNAARLRGVPREKRPALPPGYAASRRAPDGPLRQLVSLEDHRIAIDVGALGPEYAHAVLASLVGGGPRLYMFSETAGSLAGGLEWAARMLARILLVAALLHLPFASRPTVPTESRSGERIARWVDLALPGTLDLARGRAARGACVLGLLALLALLARAGLVPGSLENIATARTVLATTFAPAAHEGLFRPEWLATMGHAVLVAFVLVYVAHWTSALLRRGK